MPDVLELVAKLNDGLPAHGEEDDPDQAERRLLAHLLLYHYRESKPTWWRYFDLRGKPLADLMEDRDAIAGLVRDHSLPPTPYKRSLDYTFTFPTQEFRLKPGAADDPTTGQRYKVARVGEDHVVLRRNKNKPPPEPVALVDGTTIPLKALREALMALARSVLAEEDRFAATRALLRREPPRLTSGSLGESTESLVSAALALKRSVLPIQGPPGTGKSHNGARMIVAALKAGRRVAVTAQSHAAIQNLLRKIERCAHDQEEEFTGIYKGEGYESPHGLIGEASDNAEVTDDYQLVAGTTWLFAREEHCERFDLLSVDEAGQFALADAAVASLCASSVVLLGDPQQLPHVTQADHPGGSGASVLEHLLDGERTIPLDRGVLLPESWRMHPDVCAFVSERSYDSRLRSREACARRRVDAPSAGITGVRSAYAGGPPRGA